MYRVQSQNTVPILAQQNDKVIQVQKVISVGKNQAIEMLKANNWDTSKTIDQFLKIQENGKQIDQIFERYTGSNPERILEADIQNFFNDLGVDIQDPLIQGRKIGIYIKRCIKKGQISKAEFLLGMNSFSCKTIQDLKKKISEMKQDFQKDEVMKNVYKYLFDSLCENKEIQLNVAKDIWQSLLENPFPGMKKIIEYIDSLKEKAESIKISKDTWYMIWEFNKIIGTNLDKYDYQNGAWPSFLDDFYFYVRPQHKPKDYK